MHATLHVAEAVGPALKAFFHKLRVARRAGCAKRLALCAGLAVSGGWVGAAQQWPLNGVDTVGRVPAVVALVLLGATVGVVGILLCLLERANQRCQHLEESLGEERARHVATLNNKEELTLRLQEAQRFVEVGRVAAGIAHDFNNHLTVIINNAERVMDDLDDDEQLESLEYVVAAAKRSALLTHRLLAYVQRRALRRDPVDINRATERALEIIRRVTPSGIKVSFAPQTAVGHARLAETDMDQILFNLCSNARDAMGFTGAIQITTGRSVAQRLDGSVQQYVVLGVVDTGPGISAQEQQRIFEPFFTTKHGGQHAGLGLSIIHSVVSQAGGHIEVDSTEGHGTRFRVFLPWCAAGTGESSGNHQGGHGAQHGRIMVVDDNAATRQALAGRLVTLGYQVVACKSGLQALLYFERSQSLPVDLVLADVVMPDLSGEELAQVLALKAPGIAVLLCSGYGSDVVGEVTLGHPLRGFLSKPCDGQQLQEKVSSLLGRARLQGRALPRSGTSSRSEVVVEPLALS